MYQDFGHTGSVFCKESFCDLGMSAAFTTRHSMTSHIQGIGNSRADVHFIQLFVCYRAAVPAENSLIGFCTIVYF
jgi:hypothetical protein